MSVEKGEIDRLMMIYTNISRGLDHEANVINHRIMWAVLYSAGLFSTSAILINIIVNSSEITTYGRAIIYFIMSVISLTGVVFSITTRAGVKAAQSQFEYLKEKYERNRHQFGLVGFPRPFGDRKDHLSGNSAARMFPRLMLASWLMASIFQLVMGVLYLDAALPSFLDMFVIVGK